MILTKHDIARIESLGYKGFYRYCNGFYRLLNVDCNCIFLNPETNECTIYSERPIGCKAYPLIYDEERGAVLDNECPLSNTISCEDLLRGFAELEQALRELEETYGYVVNWMLLRKSFAVLLASCRS